MDTQTERRSDEELMAALGNGELGAAEVLFARYHRPLYAYLVRRAGQSNSAEDLVQEVFLKLISRPKAFHGRGHFRGWLYTVARNLAIDRYRSETAREVEMNTETLTSTAVTHPGDTNCSLEEALSMLPPTEREILVLARIEGLRYREVGNALGLTENAVKMRVFRALQQLKQILGNPKMVAQGES